MNKVLKFLISIAATFSITSCGLLGGLEETDENSGNSGFDFGDLGFGTSEDTTPASNNTPSSETPSSGGEQETPSSETPSSGGEQETPHSETVYRINFYNGGTHLGYLDLKGGTKVTKDTYTTIPTYPSPKTGYDYTFIGWNETRQNNEIGNAVTYTVSKNANLHAVYSQTAKQYTVNFKYGTTDLGSQDFPYGTLIGTNNTYRYDNKLTKTEAGKTYTFIGWNKDRQNNDVGEAKTYTVTSNLTLFAVFSSETQKYSVTFINEGTNLGSKDFVYGSKIEKGNMYGYNLSKASTAQYSYTFDGWNESSGASSGVEYTVTSNMTVHAIYTSTTRQYLVTFMNGSTTLKGPTSVNYGVRPTAPSNPTKSGTGVTYTFVGWSEDPNATSTSSNVFTSTNLPTVSKDTVYYAIFSSTSTGGGSGNPGLTPEYATIVDVDKNELYAGTSTRVAFNNTATYSVKDEYKNNYEITWSLDETGDEEFFELETSDNNRAVTITAIEESRFTYLHVKCVSQSACKIQKITLLSVTSFGTIGDFFSSGKIGETAINDNDYYIYASGSASFSKFYDESSITKYDYVIPSLLTSSKVVKKVGLCRINYLKERLWVRRLYIPETVFGIDYAFSNICVGEYMHLSSSELGFLLFAKNTLWSTNFSSDNLLTMSNLCILSGPEHYYFPYTKIGISSNVTWNSGEITYSDWNWQTNWADKYNADPESDEINNLKDQFKNYVCFTN